MAGTVVIKSRPPLDLNSAERLAKDGPKINGSPVTHWPLANGFTREGEPALANEAGRRSQGRQPWAGERRGNTKPDWAENQIRQTIMPSDAHVSGKRIRDSVILV